VSTLADKQIELQIANSIALQKNYPLLQSYLDPITDSFDSKVFAEDFFTKAHESTEAINKWVAEKTKGKIDKLFAEDLNTNTVMVLLNAIYFKGAWKTRFDKNATSNAHFVVAQKSVSVPFMSMSAYFYMAEFEDGKLLEVPYGIGDELSMYIFLPDNEAAKSHKTISVQLAQTLTQGSFKLTQRLTQLRNMSVYVKLPKFKIESEFALKPTLTALGIHQAFSMMEADFSRMNGRQDLYLSEVMHKTFVEVNEEGSEAAAATGAVVETRGISPIFIADRPFLFLIRDNTHQLTLLAGVVNKP